MSEFHNPYHFVPVKWADRSRELSRDAFKKRRDGNYDSTIFPEVTHDRYAVGTHSGRIICRLTTRSPLVLGAERVPNTAPAEVKPYELGGWPAIPASSLRGLISSVAEAASNSALRVLQNTTPLTYRRGMTESLSAIGMIVKRKDGIFLKPLTLPTMPLTSKSDKAPARLDQPFRSNWFPHAALRVYFGDKNSIRKGSPQFPYVSYSKSESPSYYGMRLKPGVLDSNSGLLPYDGLQKRKNGLLGQFAVAEDETPDPNALPVPWDDISKSDRLKYTRGILRVLGCHGRGSHGSEEVIPPTKTHELFLPYPDDVENNEDLLLPVSACALQRFQELANDRADESLATMQRNHRKSPLELFPFHLVGTHDDRSITKPYLEPLDGDLVFFKPNARGEVEEFSFSSIWRGRVEDAVKCKGISIHDFFRAVDDELLPFNSKRTRITPAERLFGFVEDKRGDDDTEAALALAGRVRFSAALLSELKQHDEYRQVEKMDAAEVTTAQVGKAAYDAEIPLKILSSPKPPSPAMYFKKAQGKSGYVSKGSLRTSVHHPQGRKFYLHHPVHGGGSSPWESGNCEHLDQKSKVTPIRRNCVFYFNVDFDNVTGSELGLLLYALQPRLSDTETTKIYHHKLGMGKPLGLGKVLVEPVGVFLVNRASRYGIEGLLEQRRYHQCWVAADAGFSRLPSRYSVEVLHQPTPEFDPVKNHRVFRSAVEAEILYPLELIGDESALKKNVPVCYPYADRAQSNVSQTQYSEDELFQWFSNNDSWATRSKKKDKSAQALQPISPPQPGESDKLPALDANEPWSKEADSAS